MTILYRGLVSGQYVYWNSNQSTPSGVSDTIILNDNITPQLVTRPAIDANHTHVWYLGEGCTTDGTNIIADVGGINMDRVQGSGSLTTGYGIFKTQKSGLLISSSQGATAFEAPVTTTTTQDVTLECIVKIPSWGADVSTIGSYIPMVQLTSAGPTYTQLNFFYVTNGNTFTFSTANGGTYNLPNVSYGALLSTLTPDIPHHFMTSWEYSTKTVKYYIDGYQFGAPYTWGTDRPINMTVAQIWMIPNGGSVADVRISDVVRSQGYALAATNAMRSL